MRLCRRTRPGATLVEAAFVYPVLFLLTLGIMALGVAVFRYQQVSHLAREGSRWASVHGARYAAETGNPAATPQDVYSNAILPNAAGMQPESITYAVAWNKNNTPSHTRIIIDPATGEEKVVAESNTVSVTVTYTWHTGLFGKRSVSSTSTVTMFY